MQTVAPTPARPIRGAFRRTLQNVTPSRLRLLLLFISLVACIFCIVAVNTIQQHDHALQTIGIEAGPSVIAAHKIKIGLLTMDGDLADELLYPAAQNDAEERLDDFNKNRITTSTYFVEAARNITYGNAELLPIENLQTGFGQYLMQAQAARDIHERGSQSETIKAYRSALQTLQNTLLPNADALDKSNREVLVDIYNQEKSASALSRGLVLLLGLVLVGLLLYTQLFLRLRFKRRLNIGLILPSIALLFYLQYLTQSLANCSNQTKIAKEDSYDSIVSLLHARADSYDANAAESRWLLDRERSAIHEKCFVDKTNLVAQFEPGHDIDKTVETAQKQLAAGQKLSLPGFSGALAEELNNIRFDGEGQAAIESLQDFHEYVATDSKIRKLANEGKEAAALKLGLGYDAKASNYLFRRYDDALERALKINEAELELAFKTGKHSLDNQTIYTLALTIFLVVSSFWALSPRIEEYSN